MQSQIDRRPPGWLRKKRSRDARARFSEFWATPAHRDTGRSLRDDRRSKKGLAERRVGEGVQDHGTPTLPGAKKRPCALESKRKPIPRPPLAPGLPLARIQEPNPHSPPFDSQNVLLDLRPKPSQHLLVIRGQENAVPGAVGPENRGARFRPSRKAESPLSFPSLFTSAR